jgi:RNA 2',3'-cyclic 3'-phosphodiesterase
MRLFVAGNLPAAIRDLIHADAAPLRAAVPAVKWVAAPALHITLKFLGECDERQVDTLTAALSGLGERHAPIDIYLTEIGAFPNFRRPRVVWVGMTGENRLRALARDIDQALAPLGFAAETRAFQAHLTLGRVRAEMTPADSAALAAEARTFRPVGAFTVQTVDLMRSELGAGGSRYSVMAAVPLHARGT